MCQLLLPFSANRFRSVRSVLKCFGLKCDPRRVCHLTSDTLPVGALTYPKHLYELKDLGDDVVGQLEEHEQGVGVKETEAMSLKPWVVFSLSADAIRPVVLTLNPFEVASTTECK